MIRALVVAIIVISIAVIFYFNNQKEKKVNLEDKISPETEMQKSNIIENVDAVSIVTPTNTHYKIAKFFLENKKHVLLEKPMTETVAQANKLNSLAKRNKCILQIGHLEQFNPAVKKLKQSFKNPQFIEVHRLCQFNPRANDVDVVLDLMIHDIDIVMSLVKKRIKKIKIFN